MCVCMYKYLNEFFFFFFFVSDDPAVRARLSEALETVLNKSQEPNKSKKDQCSNAKHTMLFDLIHTVYTLCISPWKKVSCIYSTAGM